MSNEITLEGIRKTVVSQMPNIVPPLQIEGTEMYVVVMHPEAMRLMKCAQARYDWKQYYRAVRTLRRIRQEDMRMFKLYSSVWWRNQYQDEPDMPADMREKLRKEMSRRLNRRLP